MSTDHTIYARNAAKVNASICSHRFKLKEERPGFVWCADCRTQLLRIARPRRTGKTAKKIGKARN